jgi:TP901 family phage tail tape measure protein
MGNLSDLSVKLGMDIRDFETKLQTVSKKMSKVGKSMQSVGRNMSTYVTAPLVAFGAMSVKVAGDFEASMKNVQAITGVVGDDFKKLEEKAKDLGATTQFTATQVGEAMGFLGMAGFSAQETLTAVGDVLNLAAAGSLELAQAADIASNIMGQFGIEAENTSRVTNVLAATASSANTNVEQLAEAMKYLGPTAKSMGMSIEETAAIVGVLGDAGLQGSLAGRALGSSLIGLANPTKSVAEGMANMKVNAFDANGEFVGMASLLKQIENGTEGMTQKQKAANIAAMFGKEAFQEINILLDKGADNYAKYTEEITGTNKAQEMANKKMEGFNGAMKTLQSAFEAVMIAISNSGLLDFVTDLVKGLAEFIRKVAKLNPTLLRWATIIGAVLAAIGPLVLAIGTFIAIIPTLISGLTAIATAFTFMLGPIGLAIAAFAAVTAAVIYFWDDIKKPVENGINFIIDAINWYTNIYKDFITTLIDLGIKAGDALKLDTSGLKAAKKDVDDFAKSLMISHVNFDKANEKAVKPREAETIQTQVNKTVDVQEIDTGDYIAPPLDYSVKEEAQQSAYEKALAAQEEFNARNNALIEKGLLENKWTEDEAWVMQQEGKLAHLEALMLLEEEDSLRKLELGNEYLKTKAAMGQHEMDIDETVAEAKKRLQNQQIQGISNTLSAMTSLLGKNKTLAFAQIGFEGGVAMAKGIKEANELQYPMNIPAMFSVVSSVLGTLASAKKVANGSFANGGMVFGPTMALVGEGSGTNSQNPEVIAPLDKLKSYIDMAGGGDGMQLMGSVRMVMEGTELVGVLDRTNVKLGNIS